MHTPKGHSTPIGGLYQLVTRWVKGFFFYFVTKVGWVGGGGHDCTLG